jgi:hypothetical protein
VPFYSLSLQRKAEVRRRQAERGAHHVPGEGNFENSSKKKKKERVGFSACHRSDAAESISPPRCTV